jgi:hypothetical protein
MTHEILQKNAFNYADICLLVKTKKTMHAKANAHTTVKANDEVDVGSKFDVQQVVTHKVLQTNAFNDADICLL